MNIIRLIHFSNVGFWIFISGSANAWRMAEPLSKNSVSWCNYFRLEIVLYLSFVAFVSAKWWPLHFLALEQERELLAIQVMAIRMKNNSFCDQLLLNFNLSFVLTYADSKQKKKHTNTNTHNTHTHIHCSHPS